MPNHYGVLLRIFLYLVVAGLALANIVLRFHFRPFVGGFEPTFFLVLHCVVAILFIYRSATLTVRGK
jgi:hypothetical protein